MKTLLKILVLLLTLNTFAQGVVPRQQLKETVEVSGELFTWLPQADNYTATMQVGDYIVQGYTNNGADYVLAAQYNGGDATDIVNYTILDITDVVHKTGAETITGEKKFDAMPLFSTAADVTPGAGYWSIDYGTLDYKFINGDTYDFAFSTKQLDTDGYIYELPPASGQLALESYVDDAINGTSAISPNGVVDSFDGSTDTIGSTDRLIFVTANGTGIVLPTVASNSGRFLKIVCHTTVTFTTAIIDVDGSSYSQSFPAGELLDMYCDGTNWKCISQRN